MFSGTAQVSHLVCQFFGQFCMSSCVCDWWIKQGCRLLFASHIGHNVIRNEGKKRKMWSKKWYLTRNISCDAHLLIEFLETDVEVECLEMMPTWCRKVNWVHCGIPWVNCAVLCVKDDWKGQFWGLRYSLSKPRSFLSFSHQVWRHTVKPLSLTESVRIGRLTLKRQLLSRWRVTVRSAAHSQAALVFTVIDANGMNYDQLVPTWHRLRVPPLF
jgi:hypothetical protein